MNNNPLVSILLLSMNHEPYIEQSIQSIIEQTYKNIEIIYLDNASKDNTFAKGEKLLKESGVAYKSFRNEESKGISRNLNFLFKHSSGAYVVPLSTDDWLVPTCICEKVKYSIANPQFAIIQNSSYVYNYDTGKKYIIGYKKTLREGWILNDILKGDRVNTIGCMIKRSTLETIGLFDENSPLEDLDMWIRIAEKYPIGLINKELSYYGIKRGVNISGNIEYLNKGYEYIFKKYSRYKVEMEVLKTQFLKFKIYYYAANNPSFKTLKFIIQNFEFKWFYFKQLIKATIGILKSMLHSK